MEGALQLLLKALTAPDKYVTEKVATQGGTPYTMRTRYDPIQRDTAKSLLDRASYSNPDTLAWFASQDKDEVLDNIKFIHKDPSVRTALEKLLVEGKQGDVARAKLVELAAKQGLLPNLLMHGTNEHAITGIAKTKKTIPQKSWEDNSGMARPEPRTYWTPQSGVARGMAAETSKVGNIREELRHAELGKHSSSPNAKSLLETAKDIHKSAFGLKFDSYDLAHETWNKETAKWEISPLDKKGIKIFQNTYRNQVERIVGFAKAHGETLAADHPWVVNMALKRTDEQLGRQLNNLKRYKGFGETPLASALNIATEQYENFSFLKPPKLDLGPKGWEGIINQVGRRPKVGDAGRPAVITTKLSKIAKRLAPEDLRVLLRRLASGESARGIAANTYEITSRAVPASALRATVTKPPNPALGETMRGSMLRGKSKMLPLLELAKLLMKGMR